VYLPWDHIVLPSFTMLARSSRVVRERHFALVGSMPCRQAMRGSPRGAASCRPAASYRPDIGVRRPAKQEQRRTVTAEAAFQATPVETKHLNFSDPAAAFAAKSNFELLRTTLVFTICRIGPIVRHCQTLYDLALKILGSTITHGLLRHTLFNHFCAGENAKEIVPKMEKLHHYGIGGILDYAAEAKDEPVTRAAAPEVVPAGEAEDDVVGAPLSARLYYYENESKCDAHRDIFLDAVRAVKDATPNGFAAIKLSGLGDPKLLERMSNVLVQMASLFKSLSDGGEEPMDYPCALFYTADRSGVLDYETFSKAWKNLFHIESEEEVREIFSKLDVDEDGQINYLEWSSGFKLSEVDALVHKCKKQGPVYKSALSPEERALYFNLVNRVEQIIMLAEELDVRVMVDAEWTDIQPAIDSLVLWLQRKYNRGSKPIVFNTYQCYLKGMHERALRDLDRSKIEGWRFGAKLVRGAYMVSEREKAQTRGHESPICETYEDTEQNYHNVIDACVSHNAESTSTEPGHEKAEILIASHNQSSIEFALKRLEELGKNSEGVYFGQLLGMADHLTFTLGAKGFAAYKYVPYGPIDEVVPYLIRRTQENSAILGSEGVQQERQMVQKELRRRLLPI